MATSSSTTKTIVIKVEGGQAIASMDNVTLSTKELNSELVKLSQNAGKGKAASGATGGATATVLELGRTISDSNYGIRGMANNLSQLVSNFAFTTRAAGGFAAGLKNIWSAMMGPLGLVLAFQGVIALLEKFEINSMKAKSASNDLNKSLKDEITTLHIYEEALLNVNTSLEERVGIVKGLSRLDKDLAKDLKAAAGNTEELTRITQDFLKEKEKELEINIKKVELDELFDKRLALSSEKSRIQNEIESMNTAQFITRSGDRAQILNDLDTATENLDDTTKEYNKTSKEYLLLLAKTTSEEKENAKESKKVFKQKYLDLSKIILGFQREEEIALEENEVRKFAIQKRYQEQDLLRRRENFEEKEILRLEEFKRSNASDEEKLLAEKKFEESILTAKMDYFRALLALEDKYNANVKMRDEERYRGYEKRLREAENEVTNIMLEGQILRANNIMQGLDIQRTLLDEKLAQDLERINKEEEEKKKQISNLADRVFIEEEYERQRTAAKQQNSNDRIAIDEAERNARMETLGLLSGAFTAFASLSGKATKRHKQLAIAGALIDTYAGVDKAFNDPTIPSTLGRFALGASTLVKGLMNVRKISSINPNSTSTPTPQAGGGGDRTFDFNLVGSTGTNQLAEAVGSQFQEPVQAYVVSSQMTSQQELDLQISTGASLGGD
jgi:hypothetical protein